MSKPETSIEDFAYRPDVVPTVIDEISRRDGESAYEVLMWISRQHPRDLGEIFARIQNSDLPEARALAASQATLLFDLHVDVADRLLTCLARDVDNDVRAYAVQALSALKAYRGRGGDGDERLRPASH